MAVSFEMFSASFPFLTALPAPANVYKKTQSGKTRDRDSEKQCLRNARTDSLEGDRELQEDLTGYFSEEYDCDLEITEGSIMFNLKFRSVEGFQKFWKDYKSGKLEKDLTRRFLGRGLEKGPDCKFSIQLDIPDYVYDGIRKVLGKM